MIFLASPYSHEDRSMRQLRFKSAEAYVAKRIRHGERIFSPIVYAHAMAEAHDLPKDAKYWRDLNNFMILVSPRFRVLCLPGWQDSIGVKAEINFAKELDKVVEFIQWRE